MLPRGHPPPLFWIFAGIRRSVQVGSDAACSRPGGREGISDEDVSKRCARESWQRRDRVFRLMSAANRAFERSSGAFIPLRALCSFSPLYPSRGYWHTEPKSDRGGVGDVGTLKEGEASQNQTTTHIPCDCWRFISHVKVFEDTVMRRTSLRWRELDSFSRPSRTDPSPRRTGGISSQRAGLRMLYSA